MSASGLTMTTTTTPTITTATTAAGVELQTARPDTEPRNPEIPKVHFSLKLFLRLLLLFFLLFLLFFSSSSSSSSSFCSSHSPKGFVKAELTKDFLFQDDHEGDQAEKIYLPEAPQAPDRPKDF